MFNKWLLEQKTELKIFSSLFLTVSWEQKAAKTHFFVVVSGVGGGVGVVVGGGVGVGGDVQAVGAGAAAGGGRVEREPLRLYGASEAGLLSMTAVPFGTTPIGKP